MVIELVPHDPAWAGLYETAADEIRRALGPIGLSVEHVGSTAIPGIVAKPTIDVLIFVERYDPETVYRSPLASLGYTHHHRDDVHVLFKGSREGVAFNVHVVEEGAADASMMIAFRDYLRSHPDEARRYEELKLALAGRHRDATAYAEAKTSYVREVVRQAGSDRGDAAGT